MIQYYSGVEPSRKWKQYKDTIKRIAKICKSFNIRIFYKYNMSRIAH